MSTTGDYEAVGPGAVHEFDDDLLEGLDAPATGLDADAG